MRWIALLSISISLATGAGCSTMRQQTDQEVKPLPSSRPTLSDMMHAISDRLER